MKTELSKIAQDLEQGKIDEDKARNLLLVLLGVVKSLNNELKPKFSDWMISKGYYRLSSGKWAKGLWQLKNEDVWKLEKEHYYL